MNPVQKAVAAYERGGNAEAAKFFEKLTPQEKRQYFLLVKEFKESLKNGTS